MAKWNLDNPYRLMDSRTSKGIQATLRMVSMGDVLLIITTLWRQLHEWNNNNELPFEDCSLEISCLNSNGKKRTDTKAGIVIRPAFSSRYSIKDVEKATDQLAEKFFNWIRIESNLLHMLTKDTQNEDSILAAYPVWDKNLPNQMAICCFSKKPKTVLVERRPLVWYPELIDIDNFDISQVFDLIGKYEGAGISLEWHSIPDTLCETASTMQVDDECADVLRRLSGKNGVYARLLLWGPRTYITRATKTITDSLRLVSKDVELSASTIAYLIYDPWAFEATLNEDISALGQSRNVLTYNEIRRLLGKGATQERLQDELDMPTIEISADNVTNNHISETPAIEAIIGNAISKQIPEIIDHIDKRHQDVVMQLNRRLDAFEIDYQALVDHLRDDNHRILDQIKSQHADLINQATPGGFLAKLSTEELNLLGVKSEQELIDVRGFDKESVYFMRTAFPLARIGMQADETTVSLRDFYASTGFLFEYLIRTYFQPTLFDNTPLRAEIDSRAADMHQRYVEVNLSSFDKINDAQIKAYVQHAVLNGSKHDDFYWRSWLNIFKPIRIARNKVHSSRGHLSKEQLHCCYDLMLLPGVDPKLRALKYAYDEKRNKTEVEGLFLPTNMYFVDFQNEMRKHSEWYDKSLIDFLFMCKDAKWI